MRCPQRLTGTAVIVAGLLVFNSHSARAIEEGNFDTSGIASVQQSSQNTVKGTVVDEKGDPIIGASIVEKGTKNATVTDLDGNFTLRLSNPGATVNISYIGYVSTSVKGSAIGSKPIVIKEDAQSLGETVVVGYGTQKKASLTSAISQVRGDDVYSDRPVQNATVALQGAVPGLVVTRTSTRPGSEGAAMNIRGDISVNGGSPLVLIDGMMGSLDELNSMDPNNIDNISVLKDASAAIYGARSANGVVLVTTKRGRQGGAKVQYSGNISTTINGIRPKLATNAEWLDMFYEAQYQDAMVTNPELIGKTNADGYPAFEDLSSFWWIMGGTSVLTGTDADGNLYNNRKLWQALRDGQELTLNNSGKIIQYDPGKFLIDEIFGQATSQKHSLSVSGADDKFGYRLSLGYADNNSQLSKVADDGESKYNGLLNIDYKISKYVKMSAGVGYERRTVTTPSTWPDSGGVADPWFWPLYNKNGDFYDTFSGNRNPLAYWVGGGQTKTKWTTIRSNAKVDFDLGWITQGLSFNVQGTYKNVRIGTSTQVNSIKFYDWEGTLETGSKNSPGSFTENDDTYDYMQGGVFANYDRTFMGVHHVTAMLGMQAEQEAYKHYFGGRYMGPLFEGSGLQDLNAYISGTNNAANGGQWEYAFLSYITRLNYSYKDKYLFEFLGRRDGSSKLVPEQRWKNFYSVSGGWVITGEDFMKNVKWLDFLKLRYNYGTQGSVTGIGNYESYATVATGTQYFGTGSLKSQPTGSIGLVSKEKTWETISSHDIGLDLVTLNNRLSMTFDWFQRQNDNMFIPVTYPSILGTGAPKTNNGAFRVRGWEISANWKDKIGQVTYNIGAQMSDSKTKILKLQNSENEPVPGKNYNNLVGKPGHSLYVYKTGGIFQTQEEVDAYYEKYYWNDDHSGPKSGNILPQPKEKDTGSLRPGARMVVDADGDGAITVKDVVYKGDTDPHLVFGIRAGLEWKGIDFSAFFQGVGKQNVLRSGYLYAPWITNYTNQNGEFLGKTWTAEKPNAEYTVMSRNTSFNRWNYENKDISVQNSRYIRLKSLIIGYTLPKKWTDKVHMDKVRVYFSGEDLFEFTSIKDGYDPENGEASNTIFPFSRLLSFGLDVTF